jgi:hypothetical protein
MMLADVLSILLARIDVKVRDGWTGEAHGE